jgi:predicted glycoside hydrolase/deacetylase ChbG (UPF0249 family)
VSAATTRQRALIVNADDFGQSDAVNAGVQIAHEQGIVTSASLMVRWPSAAAAVEYAASAELALGLHLDLGEWTFRQGGWSPVYALVDLHDDEGVLQEVRQQARTFVALVGRPPTHIDSHQHVHQREIVRSAVDAVAHELGDPPIRGRSSTVRYCGAFYGQSDEGASLPEAISVETLVDLLGNLPDGVTELSCHPATAADLDTMYARERVTELRTLCDSRIRHFIEAEGIRLCSFASLP